MSKDFARRKCERHLCKIFAIYIECVFQEMYSKNTKFDLLC